MRTQIVVSSLLLYVFTPYAADAEVPPGGKEVVGWVIYSRDERISTSPIVSEIWYPTDKLWVLWARSGMLLATMPVPDLQAGYKYNYGECKVDSVLRNDIIAAVKHRSNMEWSTDVALVWVIDPNKASFVPIPSRGVICRNDGYGV